MTRHWGAPAVVQLADAYDSIRTLLGVPSLAVFLTALVVSAAAAGNAHAQPILAAECAPLVESAGPPVRVCSDPKAIPCARFDISRPMTLRSNRCLAERHNAAVKDASGQPIDFGVFGATDCRAGGVRLLESISLAVIHNGGTTAAQNVINWQCSPGTAAHYTIQRDGKIFQHIGEERITFHALGVNSQSIGIELNRATFKGKSCNSLNDGEQPLKGLLTEPERFAAIAEACAPTAAQYVSLRTLLNAIVSRTRVPIR